MIYFDNSATTKPLPEVIDSFAKVSHEFFGNPSSLHGIGGQAEKLLSQAREQTAGILKVNPAEIVFTSGGTESNNLAIKGTALMHKGRGKHIITTGIEHPSISNSMAQLEKLGFEVTYLPVDKNGVVQLEGVERAIRPDTILLSIMYVNNEVGAVQPIKEIGRLLGKFPKVVFHVDAVQAVGKMDFDLKEWGVDLFSISAHKFHGLKGVGALFIREGVKLVPLNSGGGQERNLRSGTENTAGSVSMAKALRILMDRSKKGIIQAREIQKMIINNLNEIDGISVHTTLENSAPHIINFSVPWINAETFIHALEEKGIFVSTTSACSSKRRTPSKTLLAMGIPKNIAENAIRVSLAFDNTKEEAREFLAAVKQTVNQLGKVRM